MKARFNNQEVLYSEDVRFNKMMTPGRKLRRTLDALLEGIQIIDFDWRYVYVNEVLAGHGKFTKKELIGKTIMQVYPGIENTQFFKTMQLCMVGRQPQHTDSEFTNADGSKTWFNLSIEPVEEGIFVLSIDISAHKEGETKLRKAKQLYSFISQVNQKIARVKDEKILYDNSCKIAIEFGGFKMAWIGVFDDADHSITLVNQCGIPEEATRLLCTTNDIKNGPQDYVLRTGTYYICNDIAGAAELEKWRSIAARYGIRSCMVLPLRKSGKIIGTFNLYSTELDYAGKEEIALFVEMATDISFALDRFEKEKKHQHTEDLLIQSEKRFRALSEKSHDMVTLVTETGELIYISPTVTKVLGYSLVELLHKPDYEFIHPDDLPAFIESKKSILKTPGEAFYNQQRLLHKNGSWIWCEGSVTNLLNEPGIHALVSNFRDISDKKLTELQKEFDANNLNALINNTNELMWSVDTDFRLITTNKPFDEMVRLMSGKVIVKGASVLSSGFSEEQLIRHKGYLQRAFAGEAFTVIEYTALPVELWSEISFYPIRKRKEIIGTACHSRDITHIKKAESQLVKSEAFNRGLLDSLSAHIAVIDVLGTIIAVNESWKRFSNENRDDKIQHTGIGSNYYNVCENSARAGDTLAIETLQGMREVMNEEKSCFYLEYPCHSPEKRQWFGMEVRKFDNDEPMIVVTHTDITKRKNAEEERDTTLRELEHRVETRTKEVVEKNKSILDSINYAKRIQDGLLSRPTQLAEIFPKSFILFQPVNIVSGDFFWCYQKRNKKFIVVADCTGHGVPGALMSIIGNNILNHIIVDEHIENPSEILELLDIRLAEAVKGDTQEVKDGMDMSLCVIDSYFNELYFAGANNPLFISDATGNISELPATRHAIGGGIQEVRKKFETKRFQIIPGQRIYLSSDGYYSQFGGPKGKKFMKPRFIETLNGLWDKPIDEHKSYLLNTFTAWKGNNEQVDDIMIVGIEL